MQYKHDWEESFPSVEEYLRFKRRADLDKLEAYVRQHEQKQLLLMASETTMNETNSSEALQPSALEIYEQDRLERSRLILARRDVFENDLSTDLDIDPDISCPVLTNEERMEKLASGSQDETDRAVSIEFFDQTECEEVNEILKSREVIL